MKKLINLILIISSAFCFAQEPFPVFKIKYSLLEADSINVCNLYKLRSTSLKEYKEEEKLYFTEKYWSFFNEQYYACLEMLKGCTDCSDSYTECSCENKYVNSTFLYVPIQQFSPIPKNEIIALNIFKIKDESVMTIFIKTSFDLDFGEKLYLKNLKFIEGNYYIDLQELIKNGNNTILNKYQIGPDTYGGYYAFEKEMDLSNIKKYKINNKELDKIIQ
jgi:hypothetical protein